MRRLLFWAHFTTGVAAGLVILIMAATGALLAFEPQILGLLERPATSPVSGAAALPLSALVAAAIAHRNGARPSTVAVERDPRAAVVVSFGRDVVYVDPRTGAVVGRGAPRARALFQRITELHRWLGATGTRRRLARSVTGACNLALLGLALSGLCLWLPRKWTRARLRAGLIPVWGGHGRARDFNWHNAIGLWSAPILIVLTLSGVVMSYPWANRLLYRATGSAVSARSSASPARSDAGASPGEPVAAGRLDRLWTRARGQVATWGRITLRLPSDRAAVSFAIVNAASWNRFARSQLTLDARSGAVLRWEPYDASSLGQKARGWARFAHTGELGGPVGQGLAGAACLGGVVLAWTGLSLAVRRIAGRALGGR